MKALFRPEFRTDLLRRITRRGLFGAAATTGTAALMNSPPAEAQTATEGAPCTTVPPDPSPMRPSPQANSYVYSRPEEILTFRNYGFLMENANLPVTPLGSHYLLIHFDVPQLSAENYSVALGGHVRNPSRIPLAEITSMPSITQAVTMECAGTGRSLLTPRPVYVPWFNNDIGTYLWTGTPLAPILQAAGILPNAVEVLFTGWDTGVDLGVEHTFERSLPLADALRPEVMLAWEANGAPLLPQHGFPLRLIVPTWYGMASVKWLRAITVLDEPFEGLEQSREYRYKQTDSDPGLPVREKRVNSVMRPPGIPDLLSRARFLAPGPFTLQGVAWSGFGPIARVEVSLDDGVTWTPARLQPTFPDYFAWTPWSIQLTVAEGEYLLRCRATDVAGNRQPLHGNEVWNYEGMGVNSTQRVKLFVKEGIGSSADTVPCTPRVAVPGGMAPPRPDADDNNQVS